TAEVVDNPTTLNASQGMFHAHAQRSNQTVEKFIQAVQRLTFRLFLGLVNENSGGLIALAAGVFAQGSGRGIGHALLVSSLLGVGFAWCGWPELKHTPGLSVDDS